jgi:hypothetical protein
MHFDQTQEWLRLAQEYRARSDEELLEIHRDFDDLTGVAQLVLAAELQSRGLDKKLAEEKRSAASTDSPWAKRGVSPFAERAKVAFQGRQLDGILGSGSAESVPDDEDGDPESDEAVEYTWKTVLCEGVEYDQAWQIWELLRRSGIESWIERPGSRSVRPWVSDHIVGDIRILVAADELDRAQAIIANPIPQDIVDESHETVPEYELPRCPSCGAEDPLLESAEPVNAWKCEICGREWTDPASESEAAGPFT